MMPRRSVHSSDREDPGETQEHLEKGARYLGHAKRDAVALHRDKGFVTHLSRFLLEVHLPQPWIKGMAGVE